MNAYLDFLGAKLVDHPDAVEAIISLYQKYNSWEGSMRCTGEWHLREVYIAWGVTLHDAPSLRDDSTGEEFTPSMVMWTQLRMIEQDSEQDSEQARESVILSVRLFGDQGECEFTGETPPLWVPRPPPGWTQGPPVIE